MTDRQLKIALVSESDKVSGGDLYRLARVAHEYAQIVSRAWAPSAPPPEIKTIASRSQRPGLDWYTLLFVE